MTAFLYFPADLFPLAESPRVRCAAECGYELVVPGPFPAWDIILAMDEDGREGLGQGFRAAECLYDAFCHFLGVGSYKSHGEYLL